MRTACQRYKESLKKDHARDRRSEIDARSSNEPMFGARIRAEISPACVAAPSGALVISVQPARNALAIDCFRRRRITTKPRFAHWKSTRRFSPNSNVLLAVTNGSQLYLQLIAPQLSRSTYRVMYSQKGNPEASPKLSQQGRPAVDAEHGRGRQRSAQSVMAKKCHYQGQAANP